MILSITRRRDNNNFVIRSSIKSVRAYFTAGIKLAACKVKFVCNFVIAIVSTLPRKLLLSRTVAQEVSSSILIYSDLLIHVKSSNKKLE